MTIQSMTSIHTCTLKSESLARGAGGGKIRTNPSIAYNQPCRIRELPADIRDQFQKLGLNVTYRVHFYFNPRSAINGNAVRFVEFTDENSETRVLRVIGEHNAQQLDRFWTLECEEMAQVENR